jgi:hypothetical protein
MPMPVRARGEEDVFRIIVGILMVASIMFGLLELMDVIHV